MRVASSMLAVALVISAVPLAAQTSDSMPRDRVRLDVGGGMSRYGPHAFGGLEVAMNRWLAIRGEGLYSTQTGGKRPQLFQYTALSLSGVVSYRSDERVSPYIFGGYVVAVSSGFQAGVGPLGGGGLRFRVGRVQPFLEMRWQHPIGTPVS
ncbi:MAG: hypothetical protein ACRENU_13950, partial [Gemmatimonadaceae bacterium]